MNDLENKTLVCPACKDRSAQVVVIVPTQYVFSPTSNVLTTNEPRLTTDELEEHWTTVCHTCQHVGSVNDFRPKPH